MHPEAQFVVHQCTQFSANPNLLHNQTVKCVFKYPKGKSKNGIIMKTDP